jgi:hypothetical protein
MTARTQIVIDWITGLGWNDLPGTSYPYPLFPGPEILDDPDRAIFITGSGGPGYVVEEGLPQACTFQVRVRGPANDPYDPEATAQALEALILAAPFPVTVDSVTINHAHRLGGPPTPLPVDPADLRHEFTASYVIIMGA